MKIKGFTASIANYSGILDSYAFLRRKLKQSQVAILLYHRIYPRIDGYLKPMNPENFERQMEYLHRNFTIVSLDDLVNYIKSEKSLPKKAAVVTLDDGYKDNYLYAFPILQKYRVPATIFLTTNCITNNSLFWWDQVSYVIQHTSVKQLNLDGIGFFQLQPKYRKVHVQSTIIERLKKVTEKDKNLLIERLRKLSRVEIPYDVGKELILSWNDITEMHKSNIGFGAHTANHPILANVTLEQARSEIVESKKSIEDRLGANVTSFAYPDGNFNPRIVELVRKSGFTNAVTITRKLTGLRDCVFKLCRINAPEDFNEFKMCLSGLSCDLNV